VQYNEPVLESVIILLIICWLPIVLGLSLLFIKDPAKKVKRLKFVSFGGVVASFIFFNFGSLGVASCSPRCSGGPPRSYAEVYIMTAAIFVTTVAVPYTIYTKKRAPKNTS
jgi:predicted permease